MSKFVALIIALAIMTFNLLYLSSCVGNEGSSAKNPPTTENSGDGKGPTEDNKDVTAIAVPEYKDYKRGTVNFSEIEYRFLKISLSLGNHLR